MKSAASDVPDHNTWRLIYPRPKRPFTAGTCGDWCARRNGDKREHARDEDDDRETHGPKTIINVVFYLFSYCVAGAAGGALGALAI